MPTNPDQPVHRFSFNQEKNAYKLRFETHEYDVIVLLLNRMYDGLNQTDVTRPIPTAFDMLFPPLYEDPLDQLEYENEEIERLEELQESRVEQIKSVIAMFNSASDHAEVYKTITINRPQIHQMIQVLQYCNLMYARLAESQRAYVAKIGTNDHEANKLKEHYEAGVHYLGMLLHELLHMVDTDS